MCDVRNFPSADGRGNPLRKKLWELDGGFHCSIIGTCLGMAVLRRLAAKMGVRFADGTDDYHVHGFAVRAASGATPADRKLAAAIHKALDKRYARAVADFRRETSADGLARLWRDALKAGDVPGAYWALATHPDATDSLMAQAFGAVHMLSHLVGGANRADIRQLRKLEAEQMAQHHAFDEAERKLRGRIADRDATIAMLTRKLADEQRRVVELSAPRAPQDAQAERELERVRGALAKACQEAGRAGAVNAQHEKTISALNARCAGLAEQLAARTDECRLLEDHLAALSGPSEPEAADAATPTDLRGRKVLYLGGRKNMYRHFRDVVSRCNGEFIPHDGGVEDGAGELHGALARADVVLCPVDCVSHSASLEAKKFCNSCGKCFVPLKGSGLGSLVRGLSQAAQGHAAGPVGVV